jgi:hypothetical protein
MERDHKLASALAWARNLGKEVNALHPRSRFQGFLDKEHTVI